MRIVHAVLLLAISGSPALAQRVPAIVIPGRPDVPVVINGVDASWSVVEGDYGLDRPIGMTPTVIYRPFVVVIPSHRPGVSPYGARIYGPRYFPSTGEQPGYGRLEVEPPPDRPLPPPAPSFFQSWSSQSAPGPATVYAPFAAPPVILNGGGRPWRSARPNLPLRPGPPPLGPPPPGLPPPGARAPVVPPPNPPPPIPQ
jgi:hypothetical protein